MKDSKNKKILLLTSNYPSQDQPKEITSVVHYFTKEWVKMNFEVKVIHNYTIFPRPFYLFFNYFNQFLSDKNGSIIPRTKLKDQTTYTKDGVSITRIPLLKILPRNRFSQKVYENQLKKILLTLKKEQFVPDMIIGHWVTPQLKLILELKKIYNTKCCIVIHENPVTIITREYKNEAQEMVNEIDIWGFRSKTIKEQFEKYYNSSNSSSFICSSGIPDNFIPHNFEKKFNRHLKSFAFVGTMISRKYPESIIMALEDYPHKDTLIINYIGIGYLVKKIRKLAKKKDLETQVKLHGYISRKEIAKILKKTECFVLISKNETFGLVYLEAMANGCLTIASKNEGFDGIIVHGENGFLCEANNYVELRDIITHINTLTISQKKKISSNARDTALKMKEDMVAKIYIENLIN